MSSLTFTSSDSDTYFSVRDPLHIRPFHEVFGSSSDEVELRDLGNDPFADTSIFHAIEMDHPSRLCDDGGCKDRGTWATLSKMRQKKVASVPILSKRHLIDFWKDFSNGEEFSLPTLGPGKSDSIQRISVDVAKQVVEGTYSIDYQVIDCRFPYEYQGGHVINAINISSVRELSFLFRRPKALIFHCEFSSMRAPRLAQYLRNMDRMKNPYPLLTIPEIYIIEGGYRRFYSEYPELCSPRGYVAMDCLDHRDFCKKDKVKANKRY